MATFMPIRIVIIYLYLKNVQFALIYVKNKSNNDFGTYRIVTQ